jgi:hypothetical protein
MKPPALMGTACSTLHDVQGFARSGVPSTLEDGHVAVLGAVVRIVKGVGRKLDLNHVGRTGLRRVAVEDGKFDAMAERRPLELLCVDSQEAILGLGRRQNGVAGGCQQERRQA